MKKLALVLGSLLVVGTAASAKEVVPAPVVVPERVVEIVEKPVIVYRDREVAQAAPAWRPNGSVDVHARFWGEIENHDEKVDAEKHKTWAGDDYKAQLRTKASINFTEKQNLTIDARHNYALRSYKNQEDSKLDRIDLIHTYNFGNLGTSKVNAKLESTFATRGEADSKFIKIKPIFDFSEYFFKNDYVKATALEIAPVYKYNWTKTDAYSNEYGLYLNAAFDLPYGIDFQAEFEDFYNYKKNNESVAYKNIGTDKTSEKGKVELTLGKTFSLYKEGKHKLDGRLEGVYETGWSYDKGEDELSMAAGTTRENGKQERWGAYTAKFEPSLSYSYQATDFVKLYARVAGEYVNRTDRRPDAKHWRWQPTARLGFTASF